MRFSKMRVATAAGVLALAGAVTALAGAGAAAAGQAPSTAQAKAELSSPPHHLSTDVGREFGAHMVSN